MIPDAPYIREAETLGVPPYDEPDFSDQIKSLEDADRETDEIVDILLAVEDDLLNTAYEDAIRKIVSEVQDIGCDIRRAIRKIKGIA